MAHPLWWPPAKRLAFLIAISDRVEVEDRAVSTQGAYPDIASRSCPCFALIPLTKPSYGVTMQEDGTMYQALECCAADAIDTGGSWAAQLDSGLVNNLGALSQTAPNARASLPRPVERILSQSFYPYSREISQVQLPKLARPAACYSQQAQPLQVQP